MPSNVRSKALSKTPLSIFFSKPFDISLINDSNY